MVKPTVAEAPGQVHAGREGRAAISPVARKLAKEHGLDPAGLKGTGPGGRIVKEDVLEAIEIQKAAAQGQVASETGIGKLKKIKQVVTLSGIRKVIFNRMYRSVQETAQLTITSEVDADRFAQFRKDLADRQDQLGVKVSYNAILIKAVALALKQHEQFNASIDDKNITLWESINIGLAMDMPHGLIVPVIHDADSKDLAAVQRELEDLAEKARAKKLSLEQISGGTFTVTNLGPLDVEAFTPVLNLPEVGILGVGKIA
ncbi:unnamed protein product, partial [marine sediment metagenome]